MMLAYQKYHILFLALSLTFCAACQKPNTTSKNGTISEVKTGELQMPAWLKEKITAFEKDKPANPPVKIYSYQYQNRQVYFITGRCCDIPSEVYSVEGQQLCQPDGGFSGRGDGKCPDFFETRTSENLIWEDLRK